MRAGIQMGLGMLALSAYISSVLLYPPAVLWALAACVTTALVWVIAGAA